PHLGPRLYGRYGMGEGRRDQGLVCADQVPPRLPPPARRPDRGHAGLLDLCGSRFLSAERDPLIAELRARAQSLGFDSFGVASPDSRPDLAEKLASALREGWHADMEWMEETEARRRSPRALWPEVRSVIMVGINYAPAENPLPRLADPSLANVSAYARGRDY